VAPFVSKATQTIPIVFVMSADPLQLGLVASVARPGGNTTRFTFLQDELASKRLQLLKEVAPRISRVAFLSTPDHPDNELRVAQRAATALGVHLQPIEMRGPGDLDAALQAVTQAPVDALRVSARYPADQWQSGKARRGAFYDRRRAFERRSARMTTVQTKQEISETNRRRYEELRAAGQDVTPMGLPEATALDGAPIAPETVISREQVPAGWYATVRLRRGEALRIVEDTGHSSVSLIGWREEDTSERINCADTVKVQWSAAISKGRVILSDMGRVLLSLVEDTSGAHDLLVGGSTPASTLAAYGATSRNTHENFLSAAAKIGLGLRDIPPCVTFFAPVSLDPKGRFLWNSGRKRSGDFVELRAEMNLVLVLSNCAHPLDPARPAASGPITLVRHRAPPPAQDDPRRTTSAEIIRAFEFTDRLYA